MSPILLRHVTREWHVETIQREGLKPHRPSGEGGNYPYLGYQPEGIYAIPVGDHPWQGGDNCFEFTYIGPLSKDPLVKSAVVVPEPIPPECLTYHPSYVYDPSLDAADVWMYAHYDEGWDDPNTVTFTLREHDGQVVIHNE